MAGELLDGLPEGLRAWVESRAAETGRSPTEVLLRAATVQRLLVEHDGPLPDASALDAEASADDAAANGDPTDLAGRLDATDERVAAVADEFDEKLTDVRERVVQVKREADAKADADHDHPELRRSAEAAAALAADVSEIRAEMTDLEARFEAGVENYEAVVDHLADAVDDLDGKATTLASALADLRTRARAADARRARREAAADLKREANRLGVETASCGACGTTVRLALLTRPDCPGCDASYDGVEPVSGIAGLLGAATLVAGSGPELADEIDWDPEDDAATASGTDG